MRDPEYLAELRTAIVSCFDDESFENQLRCTLEDHVEDFCKLFEQRNKCSDARRKIQAGMRPIPAANYD